MSCSCYDDAYDEGYADGRKVGDGDIDQEVGWAIESWVKDQRLLINSGSQFALASVEEVFYALEQEFN